MAFSHIYCKETSVLYHSLSIGVHENLFMEGHVLQSYCGVAQIRMLTIHTGIDDIYNVFIKEKVIWFLHLRFTLHCCVLCAAGVVVACCDGGVVVEVFGSSFFAWLVEL